MSFAPVPSPDEIVRLYKAGELSKELACYHETVGEEDDPFIQLCIALHNGGSIDLVSVPSQPAFVDVTGHAFFTAQRLYCEAIPKLDTNATALMECCRILIEHAGTDGAATQPNGAFRSWCQNNPNECAVVIRGAQAGDELAKRFVTFALQAAVDFDLAIDFVRSYADDRRVSGMTALAGMTFADATTAQKVISVLEPFVADGGDDHVRMNALLAAFDVLKKYNNPATAKRLIDAAAKDPGPGTLHCLARIVWLYHTLCDEEALRTTLLALETVDPEHLRTVETIDLGLHQLLGTKNEVLVLDFLTMRLRDDKLSLKNFETTSRELTHGASQRLYDLIVRWFLSGSMALCSNVIELVGIDKKRAIDSAVQPTQLPAEQQIFVCRKAIGFLFLRPVICCSILVSILRTASSDVQDVASELLFDPILLSYGGDAKEYLKSIPPADPAYGPIQNALTKDEDFYAGLKTTGTIKELHPSDYQRGVVHQRTYDDMQAAHKKAQSKSVLLNLVRRSTILYGRRALTYFTDYDGSRRAVAMDLKSIDASFELPRREILDPVGLDYLLRVYRVEKLR